MQRDRIAVGTCIDNAATQSDRDSSMNIYARPTYALQSRDNPLMIYTVNFLRDMRRAVRIPGAVTAALHSQESKQNTGDAREKRGN